MSTRRQIIQAVTTHTMTQAQAARAYGVSPSMVSKLLRQWAREGASAYYPKPSIPHTHPNATSQQMITAIITIRHHLTTNGLDAGPLTITDHLRQQYPHQPIPSRATIARILTRHGLITPAPKKRPRTSYHRFEAQLPNET